MLITLTLDGLMNAHGLENAKCLIFEIPSKFQVYFSLISKDQKHEMSCDMRFPNNVECATSKGSDQPVHAHSLIRAFACHWNIL